MKPQRPHPAPAPLPEFPLPRRGLLRAAAAAWLGGSGVLLAGCGGGGDDPGEAAAADSGLDGGKRILGGIDSGGTGRPAFVSAVLDLAQPLTAAGVVFDTTGSRVEDADGRVLRPDELAPGMGCRIDASPVVQVDGQRTAHAVSIRVVEQLLGPVASVDATSRSFTVLGQRVLTTSRTRFGAGLATGLAALRSGLPVQVWGELDATPGQVVATRVALAAPGSRQVLRGVLGRLDRALGRAQVGALVLAFPPGDTTVVEAGLAVGQVVRAVGPALGTGRVGGLLALRGDALRLPAGREVEVHGRVTRIDAPLRFDVDGVPCDLRQATQRQGLRWLALGVRAQVHGWSDAAGVLVADAVELEAPEPLQFEGAISRVDRVARSFVLRGYTVVWTAGTVFEGGGAALVSPGRRAAVVGQWNADRTRVLATRIHLEV